MEFFSKLDEKELEQECPYISIVRVQKMDVDVVGWELSRSAQGFGIQNSARKPPAGMFPPKPPRDFWAEIKKEFYQLLCTNDRKYAKLRTQLNKKSTTATTVILSSISVEVAVHLGVTAGMLTPLIALMLYAILKLGLNSWCNLHKP